MARRALLFVYGTLQRGFANHRLLAGSGFAGEAVTAGAYDLADLGEYPGLLACGRCAVAGELFLVDSVVLARLDHFEGHPDLFHRRHVALADGRRPWAYFIRQEAAEGRPRLAAASGSPPGVPLRWAGDSAPASLSAP